MVAAGHAGCMPPSFRSDAPAADLATLATREPALAAHRWFVKHRHGVKGRGVYPCRDLAAVRAWLTAQRAKSLPRRAEVFGADFVVQVTVAREWVGEGGE